MSDLAEEYSRYALEAEINVAWACEPGIRNYWKDIAASYRRLAAEANVRATVTEIDLIRAA